MVALCCGCVYDGVKGAYTTVCCNHASYFKYYEPHGHYIPVGWEKCSATPSTWWKDLGRE